MKITIYPINREWEKGNTLGTRETGWADVVEVSQAVLSILEKEDNESEKQLEKIIKGLKGW